MESETSQAEEELMEFWRLLETNSSIKLVDIELLKIRLSKAVEKIKELRESRDKWRVKYEELKK